MTNPVPALVLVDERSLASIAQARVAYEAGELRAGRSGMPPCRARLSLPGLEQDLARPGLQTLVDRGRDRGHHRPLLAVQGLNDEYGTLEQICGLARRVLQARLLELAGCGHRRFGPSLRG